MRMADQRGVFRLRSADIQHSFQASGGALEEKRSDLCHRSVYLVDHRVECTRLVFAGKEIEVVCLRELQQGAGRSGVSRHSPRPGFCCGNNPGNLLPRGAVLLIRRKLNDEAATLRGYDEAY